MKKGIDFTSLKFKTLVRFGIMGIILIAIGALFFLTSQKTKESQATVTLLTNDRATLQTATSDHYYWVASLNSFINYGEEFTGGTDPKSCNFGKFIYGDRVQNDSSWKDFLISVEPLHNALHEGAKTILGGSSTQQSKNIYLDTIKPNVGNLIKELNSKIKSLGEEIVAAEAQETMLANLQLYSIGAQLVILIGMLIWILSFISKEIIKPISNIRKESERLADGELSLSFDVNCKNSDVLSLQNALKKSAVEISGYVVDISRAMGEMSNRNFNVRPGKPFIGEFKPIENSIGKMIKDMTGVIKQLGEAARQVSYGSEQLAGGAQSLAQGATEQASSVQELTATIDEISTKIKENARNSNEAKAMAEKASVAISQSNEQMQVLMRSMYNIDAKSQQIGKIIKTIEDIAFQTNILALNAAVEAARAGTAGKGFAVVADEVRNLAGKSAEAAKNTTALIGDSIAAIADGVKLAKATADDLLNVVSGADETTKAIVEFSIATNEQAAAITQLTIGIEQIAIVIQTNSATSEESAAASEVLAGQAGILNDVMDTFSVLDE